VWLTHYKVWLTPFLDPVLNLPGSSSVTSSNHLMRLESCEKAMGWCTAQCKMLLFCVKLCEIDIGPTKGTGLLLVGYLGNAALLHIFMECSSVKMQTPCVLWWSRSKMLWGRSEGLWGRSKVLRGHSAILWQKKFSKNKHTIHLQVFSWWTTCPLFFRSASSKLHVCFTPFHS